MPNNTLLSVVAITAALIVLSTTIYFLGVSLTLGILVTGLVLLALW